MCVMYRLYLNLEQAMEFSEHVKMCFMSTYIHFFPLLFGKAYLNQGCELTKAYSVLERTVVCSATNLCPSQPRLHTQHSTLTVCR